MKGFYYPGKGERGNSQEENGINGVVDVGGKGPWDQL